MKNRNLGVLNALTAGRIYPKKGFTLIELLVVVLIIGVLSAVAVPSYQRAVARSRFAAAIPLMRTVGDAEDAFYLSNNRFTHEWDALDVALPAGYTLTNSTHEEQTAVSAEGDRLVLNTAGNKLSVRFFLHGNRTAYLEYYFQNRSDYGRAFAQPLVCWAQNNSREGNGLCKSFAGGEEPVISAAGNAGYNVKF